MPVRIPTLRPSLLVSLSSRIKGNCTYRTNDIERDHIDYDGSRKAKWETERTVSDPAEYEEAVKVRCEARNIVTRVCATSAHGLLCLLDNRQALLDAIDQARDLAASFNSRATMTRVEVTAIVGEIAQSDVQAIRAINSEITDLLEAMETGVRKLDPAAIRDAAKRAKALTAVCTPGASEKLQDAIDKARLAARKLVKSGEVAAEEVNAEAIRQITASRLAFLDIDEAPLQVEVSTVAPSRALDLPPEDYDEEMCWDSGRPVPFVSPDY